jgi:uncharacterized protein YbaP (TraB family)
MFGPRLGGRVDRHQSRLVTALRAMCAGLLPGLLAAMLLSATARADQPPTPASTPTPVAAPTPAPAPAPPPASSSPPAVMDEIVVTSERTGPGMWHVSRGAAQLYILGSMSPLPKGITWRSKQVEQVLDGAKVVLVQKPLDIGIVRILWVLITERSVLLIRGGRRLKDVLPADLYARFALQRDKYTDDDKKWERFRPIIAAAFLQQAAFHKVGLSTRIDLGAAMRTLAQQHHVPLQEIKVTGVGDVLDTLKTLPPATENTCVDASLVTVESGLPRLLDRAEAWATGNVERIQNLPEPQVVDACRIALEASAGTADLISLMRQTWFAALEKNLHSGGVSVAVVNIDMLLEPGGLLDELRAQGYQVDAPGQ